MERNSGLDQNSVRSPTIDRRLCRHIKVGTLTVLTRRLRVSLVWDALEYSTRERHVDDEESVFYVDNAEHVLRDSLEYKRDWYNLGVTVSD